MEITIEVKDGVAVALEREGKIVIGVTLGMCETEGAKASFSLEALVAQAPAVVQFVRAAKAQMG